VRRAAAAWAPVLAFAGLLFYVSSLSSVPTPHVAGFDKVEHFTAYGVLALLACRACAATGLDPRWGLVIASFYGVTDEVHQAFVPGRSSDVFDWAADTLGAAATLFLFSMRRRRAAPAPTGTGKRASVPVSVHD
jgi:VanZ family protein